MAPTTTGALAPPGTTPHLAGPSRENPEHRNLPRITTHSIKAMADDAEHDSMLYLGGNTANNATGGGGDPTPTPTTTDTGKTGKIDPCRCL